MIATRPMPYRRTANESLPPILAPDDSIIVTVENARIRAWWWASWTMRT